MGRPEESEGTFRRRLREACRELRNLEMEERRDVVRARKRVAELKDAQNELERELQEKLILGRENFVPEAVEIKEKLVKPRKAEIQVRYMGLAWLPWVMEASGAVRPAYDVNLWGRSAS
jgi:hypothetical protein